MPKRSNEKQQVIEMLKALTAADGWTVTPSKFLWDSELKRDVEVDVVAEKDDDGHRFTQCFEVTDPKRRSVVGWADEMIRKHERLPTDRLFLVSWSGFVQKVHELAAQPDNHWVTLAQPIPIEHGKGEDIALWMEEIEFTLGEFALFTRDEAGAMRQLPITPASLVRRADRSVLGPPRRVPLSLLRHPNFGEFASKHAHDLPNREAVKTFSTTLAIQSGGVLLDSDGTNPDLVLITDVRITGKFGWHGQRIEMTAREFAGKRFTHGKSVINGKPSIVVASLDDELNVVKTKVEVEKLPRAKKKAAKPKNVTERQKARRRATKDGKSGATRRGSARSSAVPTVDEE